MHAYAHYLLPPLCHRQTTCQRNEVSLERFILWGEFQNFNSFRAHARPVIRLQMINEPADPLNGLPEPHAETPTVKTRRKQVLITLSDSPLIQEHKVSLLAL